MSDSPENKPPAPPPPQKDQPQPPDIKEALHRQGIAGTKTPDGTFHPPLTPEEQKAIMDANLDLQLKKADRTRR